MAVDFNLFLTIKNVSVGKTRITFFYCLEAIKV